MEKDKYNQEAKLYELIGEEVMDTHVKEMLDEILNEYDDVVSKGPHDIGNCTQVKHDIRLNDERPIKRKQSPRSAKENETNLALYLTYLGRDSMLEWMKTDKYN